jgi:hypothetical protein
MHGRRDHLAGAEVVLQYEHDALHSHCSVAYSHHVPSSEHVCSVGLLGLFDWLRPEHSSPGEHVGGDSLLTHAALTETLMRRPQRRPLSGPDHRDIQSRDRMQLITGALPHTAAEAHGAAVVPMLDQLEELKLLPEEVLADTTYGADDNV